MYEDGHAEPDEWAFSVGAGVLIAPKYLGDDAYGVSAVPSIRVSYDDKFSASVEEGARYNLIHSETFRAGPLARIEFGRDEDGSGPFRISGSDTNDLIGLGDIDTTIGLGGLTEIDFGKAQFSAQLTKAIGGHQGVKGQMSLSYTDKVRLYGPPLIYSLGSNVKFGDDTYMDAFFGVNNAQSAASGLSPFDASAGVSSYGVSATAIMPITQNVSITMIAQYDRLVSDAGQSSLVQERGGQDQGFVGLLTSYTFK